MITRLDDNKIPPTCLIQQQTFAETCELHVRRGKELLDKTLVHIFEENIQKLTLQIF